MWTRQTDITLKSAHKLVKRSLQDQYFQNWNGQLNISSKGKNYRLFKHDLKLEPYLTELPENMRLAMFRFRTDNHRMPVETGRWSGSRVPYEERKCMLCDSNGIGDPYHYLLLCPFFRDSRVKYIPMRFYLRPNVLKFSDLMNTSKSPQLMKNIVIFAKEIMQTFT